MNKKMIDKIEKMNVNKCRYCGRELKGLTACNCTQKLSVQKLWDGNIRRRDRVRIVDTKPKKYINV